MEGVRLLSQDLGMESLEVTRTRPEPAPGRTEKQATWSIRSPRVEALHLECLGRKELVGTLLSLP